MQPVSEIIIRPDSSFAFQYSTGDKFDAFCDVCGTPATSAASDWRREPDVMTGLWWNTLAGWRFGCPLHPAQGRLIR